MQKSREAECSGRWLITGVAGFIGSNILEELLSQGAEVVGLDNFSSGSRQNLDEVKNSAGAELWSRFRLIEGDITDSEMCKSACKGVQYILHHAALASVPDSLKNPTTFHKVNVNGFLNILQAAAEQKVRRIVYATSSAVYGDDPTQPKREDILGQQLSPYALNKLINEQYAKLYTYCYGVETVGLRYFNVFGRRQNPEGSYAAVIPKWTISMLKGFQCTINGDGEITRDFCHVDNVVGANILAAKVDLKNSSNRVFNIGGGSQTTLLGLYRILHSELERQGIKLINKDPIHAPYRTGDILHSSADISRAERELGYKPSRSLLEGLSMTINWYIKDAQSKC